MNDDTAHTAQEIADDALTVAKALGFVCPPLIIPATAVKLIVDVAAFAIFLRRSVLALDAQRAAQTSGVAAAESQAATTAMERTRRPATGRICRPCFDVIAALVDEDKVPA